MRILLVYPYLGFKRSQLTSLFYHRTLSLEQVAAVTPPIHTIEILDEMLEKIDFTKKYDLVGITCITCNSLRAYYLADEFMRQGIPVVLGGYHPTAMPHEAKQHATAVVIGEAERTWPKLLVDFENNRLQPFYHADSFVDPAVIPPPKRNLSYKILGPSSIQIARGCPIKCDFCAIHPCEGTSYRIRPLKNVLNEINSIPSKYLFFIDASLTMNPSYSKNLFREMRDLNKYFNCYGNINVLGKDEELLQLAVEAGCRRWFIGFESISQKTIDGTGKITNKVKQYENAIKNIKDYGMMISGLFMFGFDTDYPVVFDKTLSALNKWDIDIASFSIVTPYPGTTLFRRLHEEGRITSYDWSKYTEGNVNFIPKHMSQNQLLQGVRYACSEYYSFSNSLRRCITSNNLGFHNLLKKFILNFHSIRSFNKQLYEASN